MRDYQMLHRRHSMRKYSIRDPQKSLDLPQDAPMHLHRRNLYCSLHIPGQGLDMQQLLKLLMNHIHPRHYRDNNWNIGLTTTFVEELGEGHPAAVAVTSTFRLLKVQR